MTEQTPHVDFAEVASESVEDSVAHERDITSSADSDTLGPYAVEPDPEADPGADPGAGASAAGADQPAATGEAAEDPALPPGGDVVNTITAAIGQ